MKHPMRFVFNVLVVAAIFWLIVLLARAFDAIDEQYLSHPEVLQREFQNRVSRATHGPAMREGHTR